MRSISLLILIFLCYSSTSYKPSKPNIVLLMAEDISIDLETYGLKGLQTPNLNWMANNGSKFNRFYGTNPICSPNRSALMIGVHQVKMNTHQHRSNRKYILPNGIKPFTYWLRKNGYRTHIGLDPKILGSRAYGEGKFDTNFKNSKFGEWDGENNFGLFDTAENISKESQEPFFAQITLNATHRGRWWTSVRNESNDPVNVDSIELPPYMYDHKLIRLDWAKYLDQVEFVDQQVGKFFEYLKEEDLDQNTIVIFIGDNGRCNVRGKGYLFEPGINIPLLIYNPFNKKNKVINDLVTVTDLTATILDYAGINKPEYMTGNSFLNDDFNREYVYAARDQWDEIMDKSRAIVTKKWKYIRNYKPEIPYDAGQAYLEFYRPAVHIMRTAKTKNLLTNAQLHFFKESKDLEELYDLENDPHETENLALDPSFQNVINKFRIEHGKNIMKGIDQCQTNMSPLLLSQWIFLNGLKTIDLKSIKECKKVMKSDSQSQKMNITRTINKYICQDLVYCIIHHL